MLVLVLEPTWYYKSKNSSGQTIDLTAALTRSRSTKELGDHQVGQEQEIRFITGESLGKLTVF